jgi:carboxyl-terminal processing protease
MYQKIRGFMSKHFFSIVIGLTITGLFFGYQSQGRSDFEDGPKARHAKILKNVGILLEEGHYSPKKLDDVFSKQVLKTYLEELDDEKNTFLQSDIEALRKFEKGIDDEIKGKSLESFYAIQEIYLKRIAEVAKLYKTVLSKPMDFKIDEKFQPDPEKRNFAKNNSEREELWRKRMKFAVLTKWSDLKDEQERRKNDSGFVFKADSTLQREAREQIAKQMDRYFTTKKTRETQDELFGQFINTITTSMDPHSNYFPPVDVRGFNEAMRGSFFGIGAQLKEDDGRIRISSLVSGGPAWKSGELKENDEIIKVGQGSAEPVDVTGYSVSDAVKLIRGSTKGSEVSLTVRRTDGSIKVIKLKRDEINLDETFAKSAIINGKNKIGYIYLPEFYADFERPNGPRCAQDVAKEIKKLKAENVSGIILDLRGNGGGSLYDVVQMVGLFIKDGPVCQVRGRDEKPSVLKDNDQGVLYDGPLTVMVDGTSASASEIFAAAIQDYNRGIIVGSASTYGKGTVQRMIPLNPDGGVGIMGNKTEELGNVKLTLQKFYRINGGATQLRGVTPDIIFPDRYDYLKYKEKDNVSALKWDEIPKATYQKSENTFDQIISSASAEINNDDAFSGIKKQVSMLDQMSNNERSLSYTKYKDEQKQFNDAIKKMDELYKLQQPISIINLAVDESEFNSTPEKTDRNKQWLKMRKTDIFLEESAKIMDKMIADKNLVKRD